MFQTANAYKELRKYLVEEGLLYAVISLPAGVFNPYSGVKTSILLIDKSFAKLNDKILFVKISNDGFDLGAQRREIEGNEIPEAIRIIHRYQNGENVTESPLVNIATKNQIAEQTYILSGDRYNASVIISSKWDMVKIGDICEIERGASPGLLVNTSLKKRMVLIGLK